MRTVCTSGKSMKALHHREFTPKRGVHEKVVIEGAEQPAAGGRHHTGHVEKGVHAVHIEWKGDG